MFVVRHLVQLQTLFPPPEGVFHFEREGYFNASLVQFGVVYDPCVEQKDRAGKDRGDRRKLCGVLRSLERWLGSQLDGRQSLPGSSFHLK